MYIDENKLEKTKKTLSKKISDITTEMLVPCPIDDHNTIGVQSFEPKKTLSLYSFNKNNDNNIIFIKQNNTIPTYLL